VKKWLFVGVFMLAWASANAQKSDLYFSFHGAIQLTALFNPTGETGIRTVPFPGLRFGYELGDQTWRVGVAFSSVGLFPIFGSLSSYLYLKYLQPDFYAIYGGVGYTLQYTFLSGSFTQYHLLLGLEMPGGWNIEFTPGISRGTRYIYEPLPVVQGKTPAYTRSVEVTSFTFGITLGWSWKF
jgi:hypothetical protein